MFHKLLLVFTCVLFYGCTKSLSPSKQKPTGEKITEYSEDISVFRPKYVTAEKPKETSIIVKKEPTSKEIGTKITSDTEAINQIIAKKTELYAQNKESQGYRIQLFSGNSKSDFESTKTYILKYFSELEIYESYSQPTYKIKVGDFIMRADAEKYVGNLKSRFGNTRIISEKINLNKAQEIK
jgi:hypothetical protein